MRMLSVFALLAGGIVLGPASAEEKEKAKDKPLTGSFTRKAGDLELKLVFKKDNVMEFHVSAADVGCVMTSKYTKEKDGTIKCELTNFEKKGDFPVNKDKGYKFSFKVEMKDKKLVMSDLNGDDIDDNAKQALQGDYLAKTD
ncbi:MAG: hypothetical protein EXS09_05750 [Gemmataceae bacterium]|nr:hypothetical protein [Gemmataceae bacterium]